MSTTPRPMTALEVAAYLGLAAQTVRAQIRNGKITAEKVGRDYLIDFVEVQRYGRDSAGQPGLRLGAKLNRTPAE